MSGVFDGQVAPVTGGSSGLGRAAAVAFAAQGARVVVVSRRSGESEDTVRSIREAGGDATFIKADVSIAWPDGTTSEARGLRANEIHTLSQEAVPGPVK